VSRLLRCDCPEQHHTAGGERYRNDAGRAGTSGHGAWGTFALGSPQAQNGHNLFSGSTGVPFNPVIPNPASDTQHLIGSSSRHIGTRAGGEVFSLD
jgi:hypothetical protein